MKLKIKRQPDPKEEPILEFFLEERTDYVSPTGTGRIALKVKVRGTTQVIASITSEGIHFPSYVTATVPLPREEGTGVNGPIKRFLPGDI